MGHASSNNPTDYLRPSRLDIYHENDPRMALPKSRFPNPQHSNVSSMNPNNDLDSPVKPSPQSKRFSYGDNYTHLPSI